MTTIPSLPYAKNLLKTPTLMALTERFVVFIEIVKHCSFNFMESEQEYAQECSYLMHLSIKMTVNCQWVKICLFGN